MNGRFAWRVLAGASALALIAGGCSDDDTTTTSGEAADPADSEYCQLSREMDAQDEFFSAAQLEALRDVAPEEISEELDLVVPVFLEAIEAGDPFTAFEDPIVEENIGAIEAFDEDVCGIAGDDGDDGDDGDEDAAVNPEFADYCELATELDAQEDFPAIAQLEALQAVAPEAISEEIDLVVAAFIAAGDDPFAAFDDPAVEEAFGPIEEFEAQECGIESGEDEDDAEQDPSVTELDPAAARVDVVATEYAFALTPAPAAGRTSFVMSNQGQERHVMLLFRVAEGFTIDDVTESEGDEGVAEEFESDTAAPGEEAVLTTDLVTGEYGLVCYIPDAEGQPHFLRGMQAVFTIE